MRSRFIPAALSLVLASPAFAQAPVPTIPALTQGEAGTLTLRDALDEAFERNAELLALRRSYEAAATVPAQSRHLDAPMLEAQIWEWPLTTLNPARTGMYMFMMEQDLPGKGKRASRALVAERDAAVLRHQIGIRTNALLEAVRQAFADLAVAREAVLLYDREIPVLRDIADAATFRYAAGHSGQHDSVASIVELSRLQADALNWKLRVQRAEAAFNVLLGRPVDARVEPLMAQALTVIPFEPATVALERHPELAMANAELAREEAELARLGGERKPDYVVGGGYMLTPGNVGAWTARAGISWPNAPWSRGRLDAIIETQRRRVEAATARRDAVATAVRRDVRDAQLRVQTARERVSLLASTVVPHVEHAFEVSRAAYASSRGEFDDVISSQRELLRARVEYAEARGEFEMALAQFERAMGDARDDRWGQP